MTIRATVWFIPESETALHVFKAAWGADNGYETAVFPTKDEAIAFAMKRWGLRRDQVRVKT